MNTTEQTIVSCNDLNLTKVPTNLPSTTVFLDLSANNIIDLGGQKFKGYPNMVNLTISQNGLTEIKIGAFEGLRNLQCLSLRNNTIRYNSAGFKPGVFAPLENLKILNIQQNFSENDYTDESYELDALSDLRFLEHLFLDGIPGQNLGVVFKNLTSLQELIFNGRWGRCLLPKLTPRFFPDGTVFTHITVFGCSLDKIEAKSFQALTHLQFLDLSFNEKLTFRSMSNITDGLEFTNIRTIKLIKIHKIFGPCVTLTEENLRGLSNLTLKELYLDFNKITTLQTGSVKFIPLSLETISLKDNALLVDQYVVNTLIHMLNSSIQRIIISDQYSYRRTEQNKHSYNYMDEPDLFIKKRNLRSHQTSKFLQNEDDAPVNIDSDRSLKSRSKSAGIKTKLDHIKTWHYMKRNAGDYNHALTKSTVGDHLLSSKVKEGENAIKRNKAKSVSDSYIPFCSIKIPLPKNLRFIDASNMKVRMKMPSVCITTANNLKEVNLSRNMIWEWNGTILGVENLTTLDLSWNSCGLMGLSIFQYMPNLQFLNLSKNYLGTSINKDQIGTIFQNQGKLNSLDISQNRLTKLADNIFVGLKKLTHLYLSQNLLKEFHVNLSHMNLLAKLELNNNQLETIESPLRLVFDRQAKEKHFSLNLENNNFKCDCANMDFLLWLSESKVNFHNKHNYVCYFSDERSKVGNLSEAIDIYHELEKKCRFENYVSLITVCTAAIVLVFSLTGAAIVYRYRWNLRYVYYMAKYKTGRTNRRPRGYQPVAAEDGETKDVNVSYADEDCGFVRQKLFQELEENRGLKLYIRDRHAPVDERFICDNILDAIECTRKTLIVMSRAYLQHKWCIFEMQMASIKALKTDSNLLCVLILETVPNNDLPLKVMKIIKDHNNRRFLEYPGPSNVQDCFWDRLKDLCTDE